MPTIVIVGAGTVGRALGSNLLGVGHRVRYAVRDTASVEVPEGAEVGPVGAAAAAADLVLLAVPFGAVGQVIPRLGLAPRQILIDATNPFASTPATTRAAPRSSPPWPGTRSPWPRRSTCSARNT